MKNNLIKSIIAISFSLILGISIHAHAASGDVTRSGNFTGASDHVTKGKVEVLKMSDGYVVKLGSDFSLDGAPDPKLAFGKGSAKPAIFAVLKSNNGEQTYKVPASINPDEYDTFYIWCEKYSVPLGVTSLK